MELQITIKVGEDTNTRSFTFSDTDEAHNEDWNEKVQMLIEDMVDYRNDKSN